MLIASGLLKWWPGLRLTAVTCPLTDGLSIA
jgi:hypothetical protein